MYFTTRLKRQLTNKFNKTYNNLHIQIFYKLVNSIIEKVETTTYNKFVVELIFTPDVR